MAIVPSRRRLIQALLAELGGDDPVARDAAAARLTLLGERAVEPLLTFLETAPSAGRLAALALLEARPDRRARPALTRLVREAEPEVAAKAAELLARDPSPQALATLREAAAHAAAPVAAAALAALGRLAADGVPEALDAVLEQVLDAEAGAARRGDALAALRSLEPRALRPLLKRLTAALPPGLRRQADALLAREAPADPVDRLILAAGDPAGEATALRQLRPGDRAQAQRVVEALPRSSAPVVVGALAEAAARLGEAVAIPALHEALTRLASARGDEAEAAAARLHLALARLGSRVALYELRERLARRPVRAAQALLEVVARVGDATCLAPVARLAGQAPALAPLCAEAVHAVVEREHVRRGGRAWRALTPSVQAELERLWPARGRPRVRGSRERGRR